MEKRNTRTPIGKSKEVKLLRKWRVRGEFPFSLEGRRKG